MIRAMAVSATYRFLRKICIEADMFGGDVEVALEKHALQQPARIFC